MRIISLDFTGTLARVSQTVGYHYARVLSNYFPGALTTSDRQDIAKDIDKVFGLHYKDAERAHPNFGLGTIGTHDWWRGVVRECFLSANLDMRDYQFGFIYEDLFRQFRTSSCWEVYPESGPVLRELKRRGVGVVITSDFDAGLIGLVKELELPVEGVVVSSLEGITKPELLAIVQDRYRIEMHVGDSERRDFQGALSLQGVTPVLVDRTGKSEGNDGVITDLNGLLKLF